MSKYDSIKTATELVNEVSVNGLSTKQEDICRAQDIFGRSSIEELVRLANDIGRNNGDGKPDPKGSFSSGRKGTRDTFYMIVFSIWNWEDACRFWNQHSNPLVEQFEEVSSRARQLEEENESLRQRRDELLAEEKQFSDIFIENTNELGIVKEKLAAAETEIVRLKAKLFDLLYKE